MGKMVFSKGKSLRAKTGGIIFVILLVGLIVIIGVCLSVMPRGKGASSAQEACEQLLVAMQNRDLQRIRSLTTDNGFVSLGFGEYDEAEVLSRWQDSVNHYQQRGIEWGAVPWENENKDKEMVRIGGENSGAFIFKKETEGWKLDQVLYGA